MQITSLGKGPVVLAALAATAVAQDKGRDYLPAQHTFAISVDMAGLLDSGLWDGVERSAASMLLAKFRDMLGFDLTEAEHIDMAAAFEARSAASRHRVSSVIVLKGSQRIRLAKGRGVLTRGSRYHVEKVGDHDLVVGDEPAMMSPEPGVLVIGSEHQLRGILDGSLQGGVPDQDLMPLLAGRPALASLAAINTPDTHLPTPGLDESDPRDQVHTLAARLVQRDDHFVFTARATFAGGEDSLERREPELRDLLEKARANPSMLPLKPLLQAAKLERRGEELVLEVDLGDARAASGALVQLATVGILAPRQAAAVRAEAEMKRVRAKMEEARRQLERHKAKQQGEKKEGGGK